MSAGESWSVWIKDFFSGLYMINKEPWRSLWIKRFLQYLLLFDIVSISGIILFWIFNLFSTNINNALYFLSAMVQAQSAIIALVVTLTLVAIQMGTASYTPRVVDVMKKNPDMWYLLIIYISAISFGFFALKNVTEPDFFLVSSVLILGIFTFFALFLYLKNTITLLRPDIVVSILVDEINYENLKDTIAFARQSSKAWVSDNSDVSDIVTQKNRKEDIFQPVFDVIHASIMRYDVTTTRTGLNGVSCKIIELLDRYTTEEQDKITPYFCDHIHRSAIVALNKDDEGILVEIIFVLKNFGTSCCKYPDRGVVGPVINTLELIGISAAEKGFNEAVEQVAGALESILDSNLEKNEDEKFGPITWGIINTLGNIGIRATRKGSNLESASMLIACILGQISIHVAEGGKKIESENSWVSMNLREMGILAIDLNLRNLTNQVIDAFERFGRCVIEKEQKKMISNITKDLETLCIHAAEHKTRDENTIKYIIMLLCEIGSKEAGQEIAHTCLENLEFKYEEIVTIGMKEFESRKNSCSER